MIFIALPLALASPQVVEFHCPAYWVPRRIAGTEWRVQACDDGISTALEAAPGNPLAPASVVLTPLNGKISIQYIDSRDLWLNDEEDDRPEARALLAALGAMTIEDLRALHATAVKPADRR